MFHLKVHLHLTEQLKLHKKVKKKMHLTLQLMAHLKVVALTCLFVNAQKGSI